MRTCTKPKPSLERMGYPLYFEPGELTLIKGRNNPVLTPGFQRMMSQKLLDVIHRRHAGNDAEDMDIFGLNVLDSVPKHWGVVVEVLYRIKGKAGSYRHVFRFMLPNGDQSGRLYTQSWRSIAR